MARRRVASKRRARSAASSASKATGSSGSRRDPKPASDGKFEVHCPQCAALYRMPEQLLDAKFECRQCRRTFYPKNAVGKRPPKQNNAQPFIIGGVVLAALVVVIVLISSFGARPTQASPEKKFTGSSERVDRIHPRVAAVVRWAQSIAAEDIADFGNYSDTAALRQKVEVTTDQAEGGSQDGALLKAIREHEEGAFFGYLIAAGGNLDERAFATADTGTITLELYANKDNPRFRGLCKMRVGFRASADSLKVTSWEVVMPPQRVKQKSSFVAHEEIDRPEAKKTTFAGEQVTIYESPLIALDHLDETPQAQREEIDKLINDLIDLDAGGGVFNRSSGTLKKIGRPAIPRILNKIYELHGDVETNNLQITRLVRCLRKMTGVAHNYPTADHLNPRPEATKDDRLSALRQWYAWWYRYHKGEYDELIEKEESLEVGKPAKDGDKKKKTK